MNKNIRVMLELIRYGIVGVCLNLLTYSAYLFLTSEYLSPYHAVILLYPTGIFMGYFAHRTFSFKERKNEFNSIELIKYFGVYLLGFILNSLLLFVFYENLDYPHQIVQLASVFVVAGFLFLALKLVVFRSEKNETQ
jgi:putative flippase GtrA